MELVGLAAYCFCLVHKHLLCVPGWAVVREALRLWDMLSLELCSRPNTEGERLPKK